jgi:hypothetical protein
MSAASASDLDKFTTAVGRYRHILALYAKQVRKLNDTRPEFIRDHVLIVQAMTTDLEDEMDSVGFDMQEPVVDTEHSR